MKKEYLLSSYKKIKLNNTRVHLIREQKTNDNIVVSIYLHTYNQKEYLQQCIESILNQIVSFNVEILLHDDASNDGTTKIIKEYELNYPNLFKVYIQPTNKYKTTPKFFKYLFNFQYNRSSGKFISICEGDDYWISPYKLELQFQYMCNHNEYIGCFHDTVVCDLHSNSCFLMSKKRKLIKKNIFSIEDAFKNKCHTSSFFIKREYFDSMPEYFDNKFSLAWDFARKIFWSLNGTIGYINLPLTCYRLFSSTNSYSSNNIKRNIKKLRNNEISFLEELYNDTNNNEDKEKIIQRMNYLKLNILIEQKQYIKIKQNKDLIKLVRKLPILQKINIYRHLWFDA